MDRQAFKSHINFEVITKLFFDISDERYPSSEKIKQFAAKIVDPIALDPIDKLHVNIFVLTAMRNMIKEVAPNQLYRSIQHRDDLYLAVIEALEDLEEELEELEHEEESEEEKT
jgi:type III secretion protein W